MFGKLELTLCHCQLEALDGCRHDVRVSEAELQLRLAQSGEILTDGRARPMHLLLSASLRLDHRVEEVLVFLLSPLLLVHRRLFLTPLVDGSQRVAAQHGPLVRPRLVGRHHRIITTCVAATPPQKSGQNKWNTTACMHNDHLKDKLYIIKENSFLLPSPVSPSFYLVATPPSSSSHIGRNRHADLTLRWTHFVEGNERERNKAFYSFSSMCGTGLSRSLVILPQLWQDHDNEQHWLDARRGRGWFEFSFPSNLTHFHRNRVHSSFYIILHCLILT